MQYKASDAYRAKISLLTPSIPSHTVGSMASEQQHKGSMDEAMLEQPLIQPAPMDHDGARPWLLTIVGFMFLTFSSALALSSCNRGYGAVAFVVFSYLDLVMLFYCLRLYERTPPESLHRRELLKMVMMTPPCPHRHMRIHQRFHDPVPEGFLLYYVVSEEELVASFGISWAR
ncbi:unnamed protein product [Urochloa decumbens]|uniref:Uncharacterized protein n=1 Tax=Urochloa decumbens TaxID=240449 RepID=A0ABC8VG34_9POAL